MLLLHGLHRAVETETWVGGRSIREEEDAIVNEWLMGWSDREGAIAPYDHVVVGGATTPPSITGMPYINTYIQTKTYTYIHT
jgi:hypothetical protein